MPIPIPTNSPVIPEQIAGLMEAPGTGGWGAKKLDETLYEMLFESIYKYNNSLLLECIIILNTYQDTKDGEQMQMMQIVSQKRR